jgi:cell division transport system permease protein
VIAFVLFSIGRAWQGSGATPDEPRRDADDGADAPALAGFFILQNVLASLSFVEQKVEVVAYVENTSTQDQVDELVAGRAPCPRRRRSSSSRATRPLSRFREAQEAQGREDLTKCTSPTRYASLNVKLPAPGDPDVVADALRRTRSSAPRVLNIQALVDRVVTVTTFVRTAGVVMVAVVGLIVLFIIVNTIRLAVVARAEEIEIMRLVGASDAFIRWPFVFEGALVGLLGALIALGLLVAASEPLSEAMVGFFSVLPLQLGYLARDTAAIVLATGLGLGILGSWVSVRTYLIR